MERGTVATGRVRVSIGLTVAGAVLLMVGVITVFVGEVMRLKSPHGWQGTVGLGEVIAACGFGCGLALLAAVAAGRPGRRRSAARSRSALRARSEGPPRSWAWAPSEGTASAEGTASSAGRWQPASGPDSLAGSAGDPPSRTVMRPGPPAQAATAAWAGPAARPARSDRARHQSQPEYAWDGGTEDAWRRDSADEWLSLLRNPAAPQAPEPTRWSGAPVQEFSPALDYSDDGWRTPPHRPRVTPGHEPVAVTGEPRDGYRGLADTTPLTGIVASR